MTYYIDTEFHEGFHKPLFGKRRHFIDLISIGIVAKDGREYYAISRDFDVATAWNSWQTGKGLLVDFGRSKMYPKEYWLRENVLRPIFDKFYPPNLSHLHHSPSFTLRNFKRVIKSVGKSNKCIRQDIFDFICPYDKASDYADVFSIDSGAEGYLKVNPPIFYGYYADYDWVLFCSLWGKMKDLPKGFPMYCRDLKQKLDELAYKVYPGATMWHKKDVLDTLDDRLSWLKHRGEPPFPKQSDEHNALADARWNRDLHDFIKQVSG